MSMRNGEESGNTRKNYVRKFKNCYLIPLSIDGIMSYFFSLFLNATTSKVVWHDSCSPAGRHSCVE